MSNLYKPWFVKTEATEARVIDSNAIMAEHLEKSRLAQRTPEIPREKPEGFVEGIPGSATVDILSEELETDYIQNAKEEAERIVAEAKAQAMALQVEAENRVEMIRTQAEKEGYETGAQKRMMELDELQERLQKEHENRTKDLEQEYEIKHSGMERELLEVILHVVDQVFHVQFDGQKDILLHLIDDAILHIEGEKKFRIRVAEANVAYVEEHKTDILDHVGHDVELEIAVDPSLGADDCVIETDSGIFECGLGTQLDNLIKAMKALCL